VRVWGESWRKADCKRLNDNAVGFEFTLHVQSSAVGGETRRIGGRVCMESGLTHSLRGQLETRRTGRTIGHSRVERQYE